MSTLTRREFGRRLAALGCPGAAAGWLAGAAGISAQVPGERPVRGEGVEVANPRGRVPVGFIIDDSTCLVNTNRFAMPQFDEAFAHANAVYHRNWKDWPVEIPDAFVRKFGEWSASEGVRGKYSIVPYPACVGRLDRMLPGWSARELRESLALVREVMMPQWDVHPEMVTHTRVIDLRTGHPYEDTSLRFMENWEWTTGRSVDEIAEYAAYALRILRNVGLPCEGVTTPGGFGNKALPQLAQASFEALRDVFRVEIPHYFRHVIDRGSESVAPRVEYARDLEGPDPKCVVSIVGCTGDWTGGWDNTPPVGADAFITADLERGRMVDVLGRGEPGLMLGHWTGIYWNGQELGFGIWREVVRRLRARFNNLIWMKLSEVARYWAAKELTRMTLESPGTRLSFRAPFACPAFTVRWGGAVGETARGLRFRARPGEPVTLRRVAAPLDLVAGSWCQDGDLRWVCIDLPRGSSEVFLD